MLKIELEQSGNTLLCRATQRGEELGRAEAEIREDTVWYRNGWLEDPEDYGLLDGLVRAAFDAARSAGVKEYFVSGEAAGSIAGPLRCTITRWIRPRNWNGSSDGTAARVRAAVFSGISGFVN